MFVLISQRDVSAEKGANRDALEQDYISYYEKFGINLIQVSNNCKNVEEYFELPIYGVMLSGGKSSANRERTEKKLLEIAISNKIPVLCECHGMQFMNVFFGGSLVEDIKEKTGVNHVDVTHSIRIVDENASLFLGKKETMVNSFHDQGITKDNLSAKLKIFALAKDGSVEGIFHPEYPIAGFVWHPERDGSDEGLNKKLVSAFIKKELFWEK